LGVQKAGSQITARKDEQIKTQISFGHRRTKLQQPQIKSGQNLKPNLDKFDMYPTSKRPGRDMMANGNVRTEAHIGLWTGEQ